MCLVVDAYTEDLMSDQQLDCINEESPFHPGQVIKTKSKRCPLFKVCHRPALFNAITGGGGGIQARKSAFQIPYKTFVRNLFRVF